jgi:hypothetical protein
MVSETRPMYILTGIEGKREKSFHMLGKVPISDWNRILAHGASSTRRKMGI